VDVDGKDARWNVERTSAGGYTVSARCYKYVAGKITGFASVPGCRLNVVSRAPVGIPGHQLRVIRC
jgi:hypothetical protein